MRLSLSQQYIENLSLIGLDLKMILQLANYQIVPGKKR